MFKFVLDCVIKILFFKIEFYSKNTIYFKLKALLVKDDVQNVLKHSVLIGKKKRSNK